MAYRIPLYFCIALLCWANYALLAQTTPKSSSSMDSRVDKLVAPYFESGQMMGATVGVIRDGEVWIKGYGSLSRNQPEVTPDGNTVFEIGSISKVFTGLLLADSVTRQKVRLDQTLGELVTDLKNKNEKAAAIRLLDLTHHKSGLPRMPNNANPQSAEFPFENYDWKLMKEFLESVALNGKPGEKYTYSNYAVGLLGTVLARNEDRTYENMIQQQIFKPLKMESSSTVVSENLKPRLAPPHLASLETTSEFSFNAMKGAGGIRSTVNDMIKFMQANLNAPEDQLGKSIELAWKKQMEAGQDHRAMGLGWMIAGDGHTRWHNGQTNGYHSMMLVSRKLNTGVILLTNTATMEADVLTEQIFRMVAANSNEEPRKFDKLADIEIAVMDRLVGKYRLSLFAVMEVTRKEDRLLVQLTGQQALRVFPENETTWNYRDVKAQLKFEMGDQGPASKVTLFQNGRELVATRIQDQKKASNSGSLKDIKPSETQ